MAQRTGSTWPSVDLGTRGWQLVRHLPHFARLYWRLLRDPRVSIWPKALLVLSIVYVLSPLDFLPDVMPVIGQIDDLVIFLAACRLFMYMCPRAVVEEHVRRIDAGR